MGRFGSKSQLLLFDDPASARGVEGTFRPNHEISVHRWYPYLEGFSHNFVTSLREEFGPADRPATIYEPFGGSGTTPTVAAFNGDNCYYSEINPFMRLVIEAKTNAVTGSYPFRDEISEFFSGIVQAASNAPVTSDDADAIFAGVFSGRPYFAPKRLVEIISVKRSIDDSVPADPSLAVLAKLALGSIAVASSELKRAGDLRYRAPKERLPAHYSPIAAFADHCALITSDLLKVSPPTGAVKLLNTSALDPISMSQFADIVITSPPYLNGTNYIRNAKLELWLTGFLGHERDLTEFRREAVTAGICDVVKNGREVRQFEFVEAVALQLDKATYDRRIPSMVRRYFSDCALWLANIRHALKPGARAIVDIGDSRFAGVHVPTDQLMVEVARAVGLKLTEERFVRARKSKDGSPLKQVLLIFEVANEASLAEAY